jgi:uncharacterized protein with HEPN domain
MERKVGHTIHDILEAVERVEWKTRGKTFAEFERDWELRFNVQRAIEIISEATRRLPEGLRRRGRKLLAQHCRNGSVLRHEYHTISDKVIWDVVQADLPLLKAAIQVIATTLKE